ncbi:hypothetical protein [Pseudooctadecabacter sp.]|uniref:hypothetical protein n=1 Tax=Pseudooctadecabacter sp. TaxID=1966338 RepID=UPI003F6A7FB0
MGVFQTDLKITLGGGHKPNTHGYRNGREDRCACGVKLLRKTLLEFLNLVVDSSNLLA